MLAFGRTPLLIALLATLVGSLPLPANAAPRSPGSQERLGVTFSVTTSGYQFTPILGNLIPTTFPRRIRNAAALASTPQGFIASVRLVNHTDTAIDFVIAGLSNHNFHFQVFNADHILVWDSNGSGPEPDFAINLPLNGGDAWHATQFVPIFVNGQPLPAGIYVLEVSVKGTPAFQSTTSFVVKPAIAIN